MVRKSESIWARDGAAGLSEKVSNVEGASRSK